MSAPTLHRRERTNCRVYFIPAGEVVDTDVTVSATTWPDNVPTANYTAYEIKDIETLETLIESAEEVFKIRRPSGGHMNDTETHLESMKWVAETAKTNSLVKKLERALAAAAIQGTAAQPGTLALLFIDGVLLVEEFGTSGAVVEREQVWARMTLKSQGKSEPKTKKKVIQWEMLDSGNNTYVPL